jgi:hypothetical protein
MFASKGAKILASDLPGGEATPWMAGGQWAGEEQIWPPGVTFTLVDMNAIPPVLRQGNYDFVWSACALDHLGTLKAGLDFIKTTIECLKPGGIAVHTTEYNLSSHNKTVESGGVVLYRESDLQSLMNEVVAQGHLMEMDLTHGVDPWDFFMPREPEKEPHLCMRYDGFVTTSVGIVIQRGTNGYSR